MRRWVVPIILAMAVTKLASAHVVRHRDVPQLFQGTWSTVEGKCDLSDKSTIKISAEVCSSSDLACTVEAVSETPGRGGTIYSARLACSDPNGPRKSVMNIIMKQDRTDQISIGSDFKTLKPYRRCLTTQPAKVQ
jgi:hypothetical protein